MEMMESMWTWRRGWSDDRGGGVWRSSRGTFKLRCSFDSTEERDACIVMYTVKVMLHST
jgi:hypothetical protein